MNNAWVHQKRLTENTSSPGSRWGCPSLCVSVYWRLNCTGAVPCFEALAAPLTVVDLTRLTLTNRHFRDEPWPRLAILADDSCKVALPQGELAPLLEQLGGRLRRPACIQAAARAIGPADTPRLLAWAEEDAHRATWVVTVVLTSRWREIEDKPYFVRFLSSALASWQHVPLCTACCILAMVPKSSMIPVDIDWDIQEKVYDALRDAGVAHLLEKLLKFGPAPAQRAVLEALQHACDLGCDPLNVAPTDVTPNLLLIAQSGCEEIMLESVTVLGWLGDYPERFPADGIPVLIELLGHRCNDIKEAASSALWGFIFRAEHLAKAACEHGCLRPLIAQLRSTSMTKQFPLFCLEGALKVATHIASAVELGLLSALFDCLRLRNADDVEDVEVILGLLQTCFRHVPQALLQETVAQREATVRKVLAAASSTRHSNRVEAQKLLQLLDSAGPQMRLLIRQEGYREE